MPDTSDRCFLIITPPVDLLFPLSGPKTTAKFVRIFSNRRSIFSCGLRPPTKSQIGINPSPKVFPILETLVNVFFARRSSRVGRWP